MILMTCCGVRFANVYETMDHVCAMVRVTFKAKASVSEDLRGVVFAVENAFKINGVKCVTLRGYDIFGRERYFAAKASALKIVK